MRLLRAVVRLARLRFDRLVARQAMRIAYRHNLRVLARLTRHRPTGPLVQGRTL